MVRASSTTQKMIDRSGGRFPRGEKNIFSSFVLEKKNTQTNHDDTYNVLGTAFNRITSLFF
jgi:hypothetical protein